MAIGSSDLEKDKAYLQRSMKSASQNALNLLGQLAEIDSFRLGRSIAYSSTPNNPEEEAAGVLFGLIQIKTALEAQLANLTKGADYGSNIPNATP